MPMRLSMFALRSWSKPTGIVMSGMPDSEYLPRFPNVKFHVENTSLGLFMSMKAPKVHLPQRPRSCCPGRSV